MWAVADLGGATSMHPLWVQILSFWHTIFSKHSCLGSWCPPYEVGNPLMGNPESTTGGKQILHYSMLSATMSCDIMFHTIWHLTSQYGCYRLKHAICKDLNLKFLEFMTKLDQNKGLYVFILHLYACIWAAGLLFGAFPWFSVLNWIHRQIVQNTETGCGRLAVVQPPIVQLSWCLHTPSQDPLLWSSGGFVVVNCGNFGLKPPEVGATSGRKYVFLTYFGPPRWIIVMKIVQKLKNSTNSGVYINFCHICTSLQAAGLFPQWFFKFSVQDCESVM